MNEVVPVYKFIYPLKKIVQSYCPLFIGLSVIELYDFLLYNLNSSFLFVCYAYIKYLLLSVPCLFILLVESFNGQKFLVFTFSNLLITSSVLRAFVSGCMKAFISLEC